MDTDGCLNELGDLLTQFFPDDHSRGPAWCQSPYREDLEAILRAARSAGATAKDFESYIFGSWMIARPAIKHEVLDQLKAIQKFVEDWFQRSPND